MDDDVMRRSRSTTKMASCRPCSCGLLSSPPNRRSRGPRALSGSLSILSTTDAAKPYSFPVSVLCSVRPPHASTGRGHPSETKGSESTTPRTRIAQFTRPEREHSTHRHQQDSVPNPDDRATRSVQLAPCSAPSRAQHRQLCRSADHAIHALTHSFLPLPFPAAG
ncbi:hypothetical protein BaRGS_00019559 [Batillaria attramentaria]|uniref:Uncharacterized protein n=1 Tax=Batillaria attramentaria TaxID=370345 RepID=A0ABD0KQ56_9CAEN